MRRLVAVSVVVSTLGLLFSAPSRAQSAAPADPPQPATVAPPIATPIETPLEPPQQPSADALAPPAAAPVEAAAAPAQVIGAGYKNGFFVQTADENHRLRIRGLVQPRFALVASDADVATWSASFAVQRAQIDVVGNMFTRAIGFTMKTEFGKGEAFIKDAFIDGGVSEGMLLRGGLWKRPFSRQQISGDGRLAFFERSIVDAAFGSGRDIGVAVQADVERSPAFEWNLGVFSGASDKGQITGDVVIDAEQGIGSLENVKVGNVPTLFTPTLVARAGYNFGDVQGYSEMDLDGGGPRFGVAGSVLEAVDIAGKGGSATRIEVDAIFKMEHVTATGAFFFATLQEDPLVADQSIDKVGAYAQAGVLLFGLVHPAIRYSILQELPGSLYTHEVLGNATILVFGQNVLWGVEAGSNIDEAGADLRVRTQAQVQF